MFVQTNVLDPDIRKALFGRCSGIHHQNGELVVHELGLAHAKRRVDLAVLNDEEIHGYEIKSEKDKLNRLAGQLDIYLQSLHKLTLVVANKHMKHILKYIPTWCGVIEVNVTSNGSFELNHYREAQKNPHIDPFILSHLLWRCEVQEILHNYGASPSSLRGSRADLYRKLLKVIPENQLMKIIKKAMMNRRNWRDHPRRL